MTSFSSPNSLQEFRAPVCYYDGVAEWRADGHENFGHSQC